MNEEHDTRKETLNRLNRDFYHVFLLYDTEQKAYRKLIKQADESEKRIEAYKHRIQAIRKEIAALGGREYVIFPDPSDDEELKG